MFLLAAQSTWKAGQQKPTSWKVLGGQCIVLGFCRNLGKRASFRRTIYNIYLCRTRNHFYIDNSIYYQDLCPVEKIAVLGGKADLGGLSCDGRGAYYTVV